MLVKTSHICTVPSHQIAHFQLFFPKEDWLLGDHLNSCQEVPQDHECYSNCWVFVVEDSPSKFQDMLLFAIVTIWELRSSRPECARKLRPRNLAAVTWHAEAPCFANTALCPSSSLTLSHRSTNHLLYLWTCVASSSFFKWQSSVQFPKWTVFHPPSLYWGPQTDLIIFTSHAGMFLNFPIFIHDGFAFWYLQSCLCRNWLVFQTIVRASHKTLFDNVIHMFSHQFSAVSYMFWIWLFLTGIAGSCTCQKFPSQCTAKQEHPFPASDEHRQSPWSTLCHQSIPCRFLLRRTACCLAFFLPILPCFLFVFWDNCVQVICCLVWWYLGFSYVFNVPTCILQRGLVRRIEWHVWLRSLCHPCYLQRHFSYSTESVWLRRRISTGSGMLHYLGRTDSTEGLPDVEK